MTEKSNNVEDWLHKLGQPSADRDYKPGHERVYQLLGRLHLNRPSLRVRIAGTNGKGSTAHMLAAALASCSLRVGLYTSPHIHRFNERIRIDGKAVGDAELLLYLEQLMPTALACGASYFEMATALALACFSEAHVDAEILEAGVGARLDATTAVPADMALITPIGLDHQAWLGGAVEDIAAEKACAMNGCRYAISSPQLSEVVRVLSAHRPDIAFTQAGLSFPALTMHGDFQRINAGLAYEAVRQLHGDAWEGIDPEAAARAIAATRVPGRMQMISLRGCRIWLDAAHNQQAVEAVAKACAAMNERFDAIFVFTREDRDLVDALPLLRPLCRRLVANIQISGMTDASYANIESALSAEISSQSAGSFLVLGSFISVAAAEDWLQEKTQSK